MPRPAPLPVEPGPNYRAQLRDGRRAALGFTLLVAGLLVSRRAHAEGPEVVELKYERSTTLEGCPDEVTFRRAVTDRLRRDPFVVGAARKISVSLSQSGTTLTALVRVAEAGHARGERRINTRAGCEELASGAALAVSIAIDPLVALGLPNESESTSAQQEAKANAEAKPPPPPSPPKPAAGAPKPVPVESRLFVRAGERVWLGLVPGLGVGPSVGFGFQSGHWSLALDGVAVLPRSESVAGTRRAVSVQMLGGELSPCLHFSGFRSCARLSSGALLARGEGVDDTRNGTSFHAAAGVGVGYSFAVGRFSITPSLESSARFATTELSLDGVSVWTTPRLLGSFGLEIGYDLLR